MLATLEVILDDKTKRAPNQNTLKEGLIMRLLISLVVYGSSPREVRKTIASLQCENLSFEVYLLVIDNLGCKDLEILCKDNSWNYSCPGVNLGFGGGHNLAAQLCEEVYDIQLILNPDITLSAETLSSCVDFMLENKQISLLSPTLFNEDGSIQNICRLLPTFSGLSSRIIGYFFGLGNSSLEQSLDLAQEPINVPAIHGACYFVRAASFSLVGGFDEDYFLYVEDIDLCRRLSSVGKVVYYPNFGAIHAHGKGSYKSLRLAIYHLRSFVIYFRKWGLIFDSERLKLNKAAGLPFRVL